MPKPKQKATADRETIEVNYTFAPYFAVSVDNPHLSGIKGIGPTPLSALTNMRGEVRKRFPMGQYTLVEKIINPEFAGTWRLPEPDEL